MASASWVRGLARLLAAVAAIAAGTALAQSDDGTCKNHYILLTGDSQHVKCEDATGPGVLAAPPGVMPPALPAGDAPTLRITQIYSTMDGSTQFVELTEYAGRDDQDHVAGLTLTSTTAGVTRTFVFPSDLPTTATAHASFIVAVARELDGSTGTRLVQAEGCCYGSRVADFAMPARFLSVDGGTLVFAGVDSWTYPPLPTNGDLALYRDGSIGTPVVTGGSTWCPPSSKPCVKPIAVSPLFVGAVEYRNAFDDRRFITASADAIDTLDSGRSPGWVRSGLELAVGATATTHLGPEYTYIGSPVCRYRIPTRDGIGYFYSLAQDECISAAREPGSTLETATAFYAQAPDWQAGTCAPLPGFIDGDIPLTPVYRVSSPLSAFDTRLTTDAAERDALVATGWKRSGFGPDGTALCIW
jgi:hypothetical protein